MTTASTNTLDAVSLLALHCPQLTEEQARLIYEQGPDAVVFALLSLAKQLAEMPVVTTSGPDPSAPLGQTLPYVKPATKARPKPKSAQPGHPGRHRPTPPRIDRRQEHTLSACHKFHGPVRACRSSRTRIIEDIPADITPVVTAHTIPRYCCPSCRETVEPTEENPVSD